MSADAAPTEEPSGFGARVRTALRPGLRRLRVGWLPILQSAIGAGIAWFIAYDVLGHDRPFFAPIAAVLALGVSLGQRLGRTLQLLGGVVLGVLIGDLLLQAIGTGAAQIVLFVAVAMAAAVLLSGSQLTVNQAAVSAVLLATIAPADEATGVGVSRFVDALIGASVGLAINALLLPVNPLTVVRRAAGPLFDELAAVLRDVASGLETANRPETVAALTRARALDVRMGSFDAEVAAADELARMAPARWSTRPVVDRYAATVTYLDYTVRSTRVLARRAFVLVDDREPVVAALPAAIRHLAVAVELLHVDLETDTSFRTSRARVLAAARLADQALAEESPSLSLEVGLEQVRLTALNLLRASGLTNAEARAALGGRPSPPMGGDDS